MPREYPDYLDNLVAALEESEHVFSVYPWPSKDPEPSRLYINVNVKRRFLNANDAFYKIYFDLAEDAVVFERGGNRPPASTAADFCHEAIRGIFAEHGIFVDGWDTMMPLQPEEPPKDMADKTVGLRGSYIEFENRARALGITPAALAIRCGFSGAAAHSWRKPELGVHPSAMIISEFLVVQDSVAKEDTAAEDDVILLVRANAEFQVTTIQSLCQSWGVPFSTLD